MPLPTNTNNKLKITSIINTSVNNFNSIRTIKTTLAKIADIARIHPRLSIFLLSRNLLRNLPIAKATGKQYITPIKTNIAINHINCHSTDMAIPKGMANKTPAARTPKSR